MLAAGHSESIEVDVTDLRVGQAIRAKDLPASDTWTLADLDQRVLVHIMASRATDELPEDEEAETEDEAAEEPAE